MNLCVYCKFCTCFIKSTKDLEKLLDACIDKIGEHQIIQIVADNASSNMSAKAMMKVARHELFCSSCAAHTLSI